ncbi:hypothetical protein [Rhodovulum marinum]|uniref:Uncharacterized protein n=1 Tax=Rhodovulum marinum TaxID=320662 RepID=A0A4R2PV08_9RHOB|nr:hypothetical protein [Rhodovulum marinum]TCP39747.1 hypothetical protein EV662_11051 [Rhodovulum marinum]
MTKGPGRGDHKVRLFLSLLGLGGVLVAGIVRGFDGAATVEVLGIAGLFFGGTALWSARALTRREDD